VQVNPWGVVSVVLIGAVVLLSLVAVRRATSGDRPDHHEPGRRVRDMRDPRLPEYQGADPASGRAEDR
jgi:hypothetical protein